MDSRPSSKTKVGITRSTPLKKWFVHTLRWINNNMLHSLQVHRYRIMGALDRGPR